MTDRHEPIVQTRTRPKGERRRGNWSLWLFVGLTLAALFTVPFLLLRPRAQTYTLRSYTTAVVQTGTLQDWVRGTGTVVPKLERSVLSPVEGTLAEWLVAEGDEVAQGALLGSLASKSLGQDVADAEADVRSAQLVLDKLALSDDAAARETVLAVDRATAALATAQTEQATTQRLFEAGAASQNDLGAATQKVRAAQEDLDGATFARQNGVKANDLSVQEARLKLEQAQAALATLQEKQAGLELTAPVAGRVMKLAAVVGEAVSAQTLLATVASSQDVRVVARLPEAQAGRVSVGQLAKLRVANRDYGGSVVQVSPNAESSQNGPVVAVTLAFDQPPEQIRIGAGAEVDVEAARKEDALFLPRDAYLSTGGERFVYLVNGDVNGDSATRTNVVFGLVDGNRVEVREGLAVGDKIVSSSYEAFKDKPSIELVTAGEVKE